jgi:threonine aldolase
MLPIELTQRYRALRDRCTQRLTGHPLQSMRAQLAAISALADQYPQQDYYGEGELIESFEREISSLLGKEATVFLPSGTMAQCIALRIWNDRSAAAGVGFHATSHLELHEQSAYCELYGLRRSLLGEPDRVVTRADLEMVAEPLSAVLLELPMREIGGQLPSWEELGRISAWARENGTALHMDGARLWQCTPYYQRSMAEVAGLFDSVYLSYYKDMGGIAGSTLSGSADFIALARQWIRRAGGNLWSLFPYVLAARAGMNKNHGAMPAAVDSAAWLARFLNQQPGFSTIPALPPTNLFHLRVTLDPVELLTYACDWSERHGVFLMPVPQPREQGYSVLEFSMGQAVESASREQWEEWLADFWAGIL